MSDQDHQIAAIAAQEKATKPIISPQIEQDVLNALAQYEHKDKWMLWGMHGLRKQGAGILLEGPPGTGKTTIARWAASRIKKGFKELDAGVIAGGEPGQSERNIKEFFEDARKRKNATIFIDECDHLLGNRDDISAEGKTWQLGAEEALMVQMNVYPGLMICATNHVHSLDPALSDRFLSIIHVGMPDFECRQRLWKVKIPKKFPFRPEPSDIKRLSKHELSGRQIENVIVNCASDAIRRGTRPKLASLLMFCEREKTKIISSQK